MFDRFTAPFVPLITESVKAPSDQISSVFVSVAWGGTGILILLTIVAAFIGILLVFHKRHRIKGVGLLVVATAAACLLTNDAIIYNLVDNTSKEQIRVKLSQAYIDAGMVDFALEVNPDFLPQNAKELALFENYQGRSTLALPILIKTYTDGTDSIARDFVKADLAAAKLKYNQKQRAFNGDMVAFAATAIDMSDPIFEKTLNNMEKNCENAKILANERSYYFMNYGTTFKNRRDKQLLKWLQFTKQECIPIWNSLGSAAAHYGNDFNRQPLSTVD